MANVCGCQHYLGSVAAVISTLAGGVRIGADWKFSFYFHPVNQEQNKPAEVTQQSEKEEIPGVD